MVVSFYANKLWWDTVDFATLPTNLPDGYNGQNRETGDGYYFDAVQDNQWNLLGVPSGQFTPPNISNLVMWYDVSDPASVEVTGSDITQLTDKSGQGHNLIQAVTAKQPEFVANQHNSLPIARFDGIDDWMEAVSGPFTQPTTIFIVTTFPAGTSNFVFDGQTNRHFFSGVTANDWRISAGVAIQVAGAIATFSVYTIQYDSLVGTSFWQRNGIEVSSGNAGTDTFSNFSLGGAGTDVAFAAVDVAEIVIYNKKLTAQEITDVQTYLTDKWL